MSTGAIVPLSSLPTATVGGSEPANIHGDDRATFLNVHDLTHAPSGFAYTAPWEQIRKAILGATEATFNPLDALVVGPSVTIDAVPYTWPGVQGAASSVLTNDGAGNLTWQASETLINMHLLGFLTVDGQVSFTKTGSGAVAVTGGVSIAQTTGGALIVGSDPGGAQLVRIGGTLTTSGATTLDTGAVGSSFGGALNTVGNLSVATNKFTVASATGNTGVGGTLNVTGVTTLTAGTAASLTFGTHLTAGGSSYNSAANVTISTDATNANTASTIVARDASGNFSAGTITATVTGHSSLDLALTGGTLSGALNLGTNPILGITTVTTSGAINGQTISATAAFTGTVTVATSLVVGADPGGGAPMRVGGALTINGALTGVTTIASAAQTITTASANALAVGLNGATNPSFNVDNSTALQVAGLNVKGAVTGGTVALSVTDSGAAANLSIDAKGSGTIGIGTTSTGVVTIGAVTHSHAGAVGGITSLTASGAVTFTQTGGGALIVGTDPGGTQLVRFGGTFRVSGASEFDAAVTVGSGGISVTGNSTIAGSLGSITTLGTSGAATLDSGGTGSSFGGALNTVGNLSVATSKFTVAAATGNTAIAGTLGVTGAVTMSSTLAIGGITYTFPGTQSASASLQTDGSGNLAWSQLSFNVKMFGAKGDGTTNDDTAILAAASSAGVGGHLFFPPGVYVCSGNVLTGIPIQQTWEGSGFQLGVGGTSLVSELHFTGLTGSQVGLTAGVNQVFKRLIFRGPGGTGNTCTGLLSTSGSPRFYETQFYSWNIANNLQNAFYTQYYGCEFAYNAVAIQTTGCYNMHHFGTRFSGSFATAGYFSDAIVVTDSIKHLALHGGSIEGYSASGGLQIPSDSLVDVDGVYFESSEVTSNAFGIVLSGSNTTLNLYGNMVYLTNVNRWVNASGLNGITVNGRGNKFVCANTSVTNPITYVFPTNGTSGSVDVSGDDWSDVALAGAIYTSALNSGPVLNKRVIPPTGLGAFLSGHTFFGRPFAMVQLTTAPSTSVKGAIYFADGSGWDPLSRAGSEAYAVLYDGTKYVAVGYTTAADVRAGTFPTGAFVFQGAVSGITTLVASSTTIIGSDPGGAQLLRVGGTVVASGLITASGGVTVASGQTLTVTGATIAGLTAASVGAGTFPAGAFIFGGAVSGITTLASAAHTITSASATALAIGLNGATNPAFNVDASTALQAAGLNVKGAVTGGTVAVTTIDSGAATNLTIDAKGTGTIGIGTVSTGTVTIGAVTHSHAGAVGGITSLTASGAVTFTQTTGGALIVGSDPGGAQLVRIGGTVVASGLVTASAGVSATGASTISGAFTAVAALYTGASITVPSTVAYGFYSNPTLVASANGNSMAGIISGPNFTPGAFTGVTAFGIQISGFSTAAFASPGDPAGLRITSITATGATNAFGILVTAPTAAANNYIISANSVATFSVTAAGALMLASTATIGSTTIIGSDPGGGQLLRVGGTANVSGALTLGGKITNYNGIATAGWGVLAVQQFGRSTAQTGAVASVAAYTLGAADGSFRISANVSVTASVTHSFTVTVTYTDENNTSRVQTIPFVQLAGTPLTTITNVTGVGPYEALTLHIRCKASTTITIATTGTFTSVTYNVEGLITQAA